MSTVKISELPAITGANTAATDVIPIVDVSLNITNKITRQAFFDNIQSNVAIADKIVHYGDTDTAIRFPSADVVSVETSGVERIRVTDKALQFPNTYTTFTDYWSSGGALLTGLGYLGTNGSFAVSLYANGYRNTSSGFTYMGVDGNTSTASGIDLFPTGEISFRGGTASGTTLPVRMTIDGATGNVGIGTTNPVTLLHVNGTIRYTNRPAAGTITAIGFDTNGDLKASSSSLRYKHDIKDYDEGLAEVMQLRPVSFKFNGEDIENIGFIAEEVDALGLTQVLTYNEEGQPEGVQYASMVSLLTKAIQQQQEIITSLESRIAALEVASNPIAAGSEVQNGETN